MIAAWLTRRGSAKMVRRLGGLRYLWRVYLLAVPRWVRWWVRRSTFHTFYMSDPDPLHDHPWDWGRLILHGRYREHRADGTYTDCGPGHIVWRRPAEDLHRVELLTPSVSTIFWHGKRRRTWGFRYDAGGFWAWRPAPDHGQDGRPLRGIFLPRKVGPEPREIEHG